MLILLAKENVQGTRGSLSVSRTYSKTTTDRRSRAGRALPSMRKHAFHAPSYAAREEQRLSRGGGRPHDCLTHCIRLIIRFYVRVTYFISAFLLRLLIHHGPLRLVRCSTERHCALTAPPSPPPSLSFSLLSPTFFFSLSLSLSLFF